MKTKYRIKKLFTILLILLMVISNMGISIAWDSVTPQQGNDPSFTGYETLKVDPPDDGTYDNLDGFEVTVDFDSEGKYVDWKANMPVYYVFVKGGTINNNVEKTTEGSIELFEAGGKSGGNLFAYDDGAFEDDGLYALNNNGNQQEISHVTFYYKHEGSLTIEKIVKDIDGNILDDDTKFNIQVSTNDDPVDDVDLSSEETFSWIVPFGTYDISEDVVPKGYLLDSIESDEVTIDKDNLSEKVIVTNIKQPDELRPLQLTSVCTDVRGEVRFRVFNPNMVDVPFDFENVSSGDTGSAVAVANDYTFFYADAAPDSPNTTKIYWDGGETVKASGNEICTFEVELEKLWFDEDEEAMEAPDMDWTVTIMINGDEYQLGPENESMTVYPEFDETLTITEMVDGYSTTGTGVYDQDDLYPDPSSVFKGQDKFEGAYWPIKNYKLPDELRPLQLTSVCTDVRGEVRFRVFNPNMVDVPFDFENVSSGDTGSAVAVANDYTFFYADAAPDSPNTTKIYWDGGETVKASGNEICTFDVTVEKDWYDSEGKPMSPPEMFWEIDIEILETEESYSINPDNPTQFLEVEFDRTIRLSEESGDDWNVKNVGDYDRAKLYPEPSSVYKGQDLYEGAVITVENHKVDEDNGTLIVNKYWAEGTPDYFIPDEVVVYVYPEYMNGLPGNGDYELTNGVMPYIITITEEDDWVSDPKSLPPGDYWISEELIDGFVSDIDPDEFTIEKGEITEVDVTNTPEASLTVEKLVTDEQGSDIDEDPALFDIMIMSGEDEVYSFKLSSGDSEEILLPYGNYLVKEEIDSELQDEYKLDTIGEEPDFGNVSLDSDNKDENIKIVNIRKDLEDTGRLTVRKDVTNRTNDTRDFTIQVLDDGEVIGTATLSDGESETWSLAYGEYEVREINIPSDYRLSSITNGGDVNLSSEVDEVTIEVNNVYDPDDDDDDDDTTTTTTTRRTSTPDRGELTVVKEVVDANGDPVDVDDEIKFTIDLYRGSNLVGRATLSNGESKTWDLVESEYTLVETDIPDGFALDSISRGGTVDLDDNDDITITVTNVVVEEVEDVEVPQAAPEVPVVEEEPDVEIELDEPPKDAPPALPQTGEFPPYLFYGLGGMISALGLKLRKKNR